MKRIFTTAMVVAAWLCQSISAFADPEPDYATFFIDITDPSYEPMVNTTPSGDGVDVKFTQQTIDDLVSGYSFRHSFQDRMLAANAPDRVQSELMGYKFNRPKYGNEPSLEQKMDWMQNARRS